MAEVVITNENFEDEVVKSDIPVLVDFWASWCGPCKMLAPIIEELAKEYEGKVKVGKVNVDDEAELSLRFNILSIPTVILFKEGKEVNRLVGFSMKEDFEEMINEQF